MCPRAGYWPNREASAPHLVWMHPPNQTKSAHISYTHTHTARPGVKRRQHFNTSSRLHPPSVTTRLHVDHPPVLPPFSSCLVALFFRRNCSVALHFEAELGPVLRVSEECLVSGTKGMILLPDNPCFSKKTFYPPDCPGYHCPTVTVTQLLSESFTAISTFLAPLLP
ncbi:unnamed protein product [Protopolystoma xenopodis]|uniref:Uncharacterized protein n=1 Tax=Protopolystoma xenopodis TaxID=117903 RepID=A0A3S5AKT7_9PLAT|nr:unnamed protein product [Protopolystoma xenopodis]